MRKPVLALVAVAALAVALVVALDSDPAPAEGSPADFAIVYERGGGFAPSAERLVVAPGRHALAESSGTRAGDRRVRFEIGRGRVVALERSLRRADFASLETETNPSCADCYGYSIRYRGHEVSFDSSTLPRSLGDLVGELESVISAHTIPPNA